MNRCLHKDPHKLSNYCTSLPSPLTPLPLTPAAVDQPTDDDPPYQHIADDSLTAPGAADDQLLVAGAAAPLINASAEDQLDQPVADATVDQLDVGDQHQLEQPELDAQQPLEPPDRAVEQGHLRRSNRVTKKRYACLNFDSF